MNPVTPSATVQRAVADLLAVLNPADVGRGIVAIATANGLAAEIRVHSAVKRGPKGRAAEREEAIVEAVRAASRRLTGKEIRRALADGGMECGASTIEKDLARLTSAGMLVNVGGGDGYGLPEWARPAPPEVPRLFPEPDEWDRRKEPAA